MNKSLPLNVLVSSWISVGTKVLYWSTFALILSINVLLSQTNTSTLAKERIDTLLRYQSIPAHISLAHAMWNRGLKLQARHELTIAQMLYTDHRQNSGIAGFSTEPKSIWTSWVNEPLSSQDAYAHWSQISRLYPSSPDALAQLAKASYANGKREEAASYLSSALSLDPTRGEFNQALKQLDNAR